MKHMNAAIILFIYAAVALGSCDILECKADSSLSSSTCFEVNQNDASTNVSMNPQSCKCSSGILLHEIISEQSLRLISQPFTSYNQCTNQSSLENVRYSGEKCSTNEQCLSKLCDSKLKVCKGVEANGICNEDSNEFCDTNLACVSQKCVPPLKANSDCSTSAQCSHDAICFNRKCQTLGSFRSSNEIIRKNQEHVSLLCESGLLDIEGKCRQLSTHQESQGQSNNQCVLFGGDTLKKVNWAGAMKKAQSIREEIKNLNKLCPITLKFSEKCHLISRQIQELKEIEFLSINIERIGLLPPCLTNVLVFKDSYLAFTEQSTEQAPKEGIHLTSLVAAIFIVVIFPVGFYLWRQRQAQEKENLPETQNNSKTVGQKQYQAELQAEQLSLELNPTSAKGGSKLEISGIEDQATAARKKLAGNSHDISVDQNIFSIEGGLVDEENELGKQIGANDLAVPQSATTDSEPRTESDISFDDVFNIDANQKRQKRSNRPSRKKIVKIDSEKYKVVED